MLGPVRLQVLPHNFDGLQDLEELRGVRLWQGAHPLYERRADEPQEPPGECIPRHGTQVRAQPGGLLPNRGAQMSEVGRSLLPTRGMLHHPLPLGIGPEHGLTQRVPEGRRNRVARRTVRVPGTNRFSRLLRGSTALPTR
jgi:hypothetical protein